MNKTLLSTLRQPVFLSEEDLHNPLDVIRSIHQTMHLTIEIKPLIDSWLQLLLQRPQDPDLATLSQYRFLKEELDKLFEAAFIYTVSKSPEHPLPLKPELVIYATPEDGAHSKLDLWDHYPHALTASEISARIETLREIFTFKSLAAWHKILASLDTAMLSRENDFLETFEDAPLILSIRDYMHKLVDLCLLLLLHPPVELYP